MYIATKDFKSYVLGEIKKGQEVEHKEAWVEAGLIEIKPEPKTKLETKPETIKAKSNK